MNAVPTTTATRPLTAYAPASERPAVVRSRGRKRTTAFDRFSWQIDDSSISPATSAASRPTTPGGYSRAARIQNANPSTAVIAVLAIRLYALSSSGSDSHDRTRIRMPSPPGRQIREDRRRPVAVDEPEVARRAQRAPEVRLRAAG